jgi:sugar/nucleoside kinase (ribokinase family)
MSQSVQLLGISNAVVDILAHVDDAFLDQIGAPPGSMTLIDEKRAHEIYDLMGPATEMSGGSVANTIAGFANLGGSAAYIGKVKNDQLGDIFAHDMRSLGIDIRLEAATSGSPTARCHVLISEDGQRTMQTYLGACTELALADVNESTMGSPRAILLEGYLWDITEGPQLCENAMHIAQRNGTAVALSLSDSFCVDRHRPAYMNAVNKGVDIVFADEDEMTALFEVATFDEVLAKIEGMDVLFVMTRSEQGSVIVNRDRSFVQEATRVEKVLDSTGAGDAYTAGFLYGWTNDKSLEDCAKLGTFCATNVIQQVGARIEKGLISSYPG